jgi:hypothetical protein
MNRDCEKGLQLRLHFEHALKEWGWFDAYERALGLMPVGQPQAYVEHMSECLACSKRLITPDAVDSIREKLKTSSIQ